MAHPFSQTMRSRRVSLLYLAAAGLLVIMVLAIFWARWFLSARIVLYEKSSQVYVTRTESLSREFPRNVKGAVRERAFRKRIIRVTFLANSLPRIAPQQPAWVYLDSPVGKQTGAIPATVLTVPPPAKNGIGEVSVLAELEADAPNPFQEGGSGTVMIEVEQVTPATLFLRASGLTVDTSPTSVSPQGRRP